MSNNEKGVYLEKMIDNILNTRFENIAKAAVDHAKDRIIDTMGCLICGANDSGNPELLKIVRDWGGKPEGRVFVHGDKVPLGNAALVNCVICRSFDFEPVSPLVDGESSAGHISGTTVTTALTVGDIHNVNGKELLAALLAADDMAARILIAGKMGGPGMGRDRVGQINSFGATAVAGRLMGLDSSQFRNAFGLIVDHLGGIQRMISETVTGFKLSQGTSARTAFSVSNWPGKVGRALKMHCCPKAVATTLCSPAEFVTRTSSSKTWVINTTAMVHSNHIPAAA